MVIVQVTRDVMAGGVGAVVRTLILNQHCKDSVVVVSTQENAAGFERWKVENNCTSVKFYPVESYRNRYLTIWGALSRKTVEKIRRDFPGQELVIHYHNPIAVGLFSKIVKGKKICTIHGMLAEQATRISTKIVYRLTFARMKRRKISVVGCSRRVAEHCRTILPGIKTQAISNGVCDLPREENRYTGDLSAVRIGYAANINELKGWRILAQAFDRLSPPLKKQAVLFFAGSICREDAADFKSWMVSCPNAKYLGKINDVQTALMPYLDVLVLPSRVEGMPMSILEAMQSGTCVIATAVGGIPEVIHDGENGLLVPRDPDDFAQALEQVIADPALREHMKKQARISYEKSYTDVCMAQQYREVYLS